MNDSRLSVIYQYRVLRSDQNIGVDYVRNHFRAKSRCALRPILSVFLKHSFA